MIEVVCRLPIAALFISLPHTQQNLFYFLQIYGLQASPNKLQYLGHY